MRKCAFSCSGSSSDSQRISITRPSSTASMRPSFVSGRSMTAIQCTSFSMSKKCFRPTIARNAPPKRGDRDVGAGEDARVLVGIRRRQDERRDRADAAMMRHDDEREHDAHAEDRDRDAPGDEAAPPDRRPSAASTVAFTTALSKESDTSSMASTATMKRVVMGYTLKRARKSPT